MASSSGSPTTTSILIAQTLGLTSAAFLSGHILLLTTPRHIPFSSSSSSSPSLPSNSNPKKTSSSTSSSSSSLPPTFTTNTVLSLISISSFTYLSSKYFMTLNQRKSELYALAAVTIGAVGLGPEVWWWIRAVTEEKKKKERDRRVEKDEDGDGDGIERVEGERVEGKVEGEEGKQGKEGKEKLWDLVRGVLVLGGGVGAGGWAVWG